MGSSSLTFKASSLFLAFFGFQFLVIPDFLFAENFQPGSYNLDKWHYFAARGCGSAFITIAGFLWQLSSEADKYMLYSLITFTMTSVMLPFNAQMNLPVSLPKHYVPVVGCAVLIAAHLFCCLFPEQQKTKKK